MGYHTDGIAYEDFTQRTCEICHMHATDREKADLNSGHLNELENKLNVLGRERLELARNYELCNQEKLSLLSVLGNCKAKLINDIAPLESQIANLQANITGTISLLNLKAEKLTQCETDKSGAVVNAARLQTDLDACKDQNQRTHELVESISNEKTELERNNQELNSQLTVEQTKNSKCEAAKQTLTLEVESERQKSGKCETDLDQANQQKAQLQAMLDDLKEETETAKKDLKSCREDVAAGNATATAEINRIQGELDTCSQLKTECNTNLASVTAERDSLKGKEAALKTCNINLRDVTKERDDCELELGQLQTDSTRDLEQLRNNNQQQGAKIITLEEQISGLLATNTTLTNSFNTCTSDLASSRNLIDQKDDQIDDLNSKLRASEQQNQNFEGQLQTCQAALLDAQRAKLDGYISSCNEMHARYQRYYEGATQQDLNWWEHLTEGVKKLFSWFHSRYDDTKPIWKESSLKALLCLWRNNSIVNENAMIKAKSLSGPVNTYSLDDLCNKEQLIDNLEDDILNPCGINDGLWDSSF